MNQSVNVDEQKIDAVRRRKRVGKNKQFLSLNKKYRLIKPMDLGNERGGYPMQSPELAAVLDQNCSGTKEIPDGTMPGEVALGNVMGGFDAMHYG